MSVEERLATMEDKMVWVLEVQGEQALAQERCVPELKENQGEAQVTTEMGQAPTPPLPPRLTIITAKDVEVRDEQNQQHPETNEPLELVILYLDRLETITCIGTWAPLANREALK